MTITIPKTLATRLKRLADDPDATIRYLLTAYCDSADAIRRAEKQETERRDAGKGATRAH